MINLNTPSKDKSNHIHSASEQPSNAGRRKMLSVGMGAAASASLGGFGLLVPGAARAVDYSTTTSCTSLYTAFDNLPKMEIIYQLGSASGSEDCTLIDSVSRTKLVGYDSKNRKAYSGILTQIKKAGVKYPTQTWTLKSSATLEIVNGEWTSNYYDKDGKRLLRLTRDAVLNPLTYHKSWAKDGDELRRRLIDDPRDNARWTADQIRDRLRRELLRLFGEWQIRLFTRGRSDLFSTRSPNNTADVAYVSEFWQDDSWFTDSVVNIEIVVTGNEPPSVITATLVRRQLNGARTTYTMSLVRDFSQPNATIYFINISLNTGNGFSGRGVTNPVPRGTFRDVGDRAGLLRQLIHTLNLRLPILQQTAFTTAQEALEHGLTPPSPDMYSILPLFVTNIFLARGGSADMDALRSVLALPSANAGTIDMLQLELSIHTAMQELMEGIRSDIANGWPWFRFEFNQDNANHRRLIGYTLDRDFSTGAPDPVVITGTCTSCPQDNWLVNDTPK